MNRILIIDAYTKNARMVSNILYHYGYNVTVESTGEDGYTLATIAPFDLILVDLELPDMDGETILDMMRQHSHLDNTPIVAFTTWARDVAQETAMAYGYDGVICKPIELKTFLRDIAYYANMQ